MTLALVPLQKFPIDFKFQMEVPFAKWKRPYPFKEEIPGLKTSTQNTSKPQKKLYKKKHF